MGLDKAIAHGKEHRLHGEVRFIRGRLKFSGCKHSAPFPSMIVVFGKRA